MADEQTPPTDQDAAWKAILEALFREFLDFFFPGIGAVVDWSRPVEQLEQEFQRLFPASEAGRGIVDKLFRVTWKGRGNVLLLIHVEVQGRPERDFAERMFRYFYRLVDRHGPPVTSLVVLADANRNFWPTRYVSESPGTRLVFEFSSVKLLQFMSESALRSHPSPFAMASLIQLRKLKTGSNVEQLLAGKIEMARELFGRGFSSDQVRELFRFLDHIMRLPAELEKSFYEQLANEGEPLVTYMSRLEREAWERGMTQGVEEGMEKGIKKGIEEGIEKGEAQLLIRQLHRKFGEVPAEIEKRIAESNAEQLLEWGERLISAETVDDIFSG